MQRSNNYLAAVNPAIKVSATFCALISSALCVFTWCGKNNNDKASTNRAFEAFLCAFFIFAFIFFVCCLLKESEKEADQSQIKLQHIALTKARIKIDSQNTAYLKLQIECATNLVDLKLKNSQMAHTSLNPGTIAKYAIAIDKMSNEQALDLRKIISTVLERPEHASEIIAFAKNQECAANKRKNEGTPNSKVVVSEDPMQQQPVQNPKK